jgi:NAD kinase
VHRRTELAKELELHGTRSQAEFIQQRRGSSLSRAAQVHDAVGAAIAGVAAAVPDDWATARVERDDLDRFLPEPNDVVIVVGQDGLVANVAKYLDGQLVIGVNTEPGRNPGVLVPFTAAQAKALIERLAKGAGGSQVSGAGRPAPEVAGVGVRLLTQVQAELDDGQTLRALNEIFVGHHSHQSARYRLFLDGSDGTGSKSGKSRGRSGPPGPSGASERSGPAWQDDRRAESQSSSGLVVGTGTGATGWLASLSPGHPEMVLPDPAEERLAWFVREAWPSPATGTSLTAGSLGPGEALSLVVESESLVVFGDGMEQDRITAARGQQVRLTVAAERLRLAFPHNTPQRRPTPTRRRA